MSTPAHLPAAHPTLVNESVSDETLLGLARQGRDEAFAELWARYARRAHALARRTTHSFESDDLVAEAFTRVFSAIKAGKGPIDVFGGYLYATIRNVAAKWATVQVPTTDLLEAGDVPAAVDVEGATTTRLAVREAFAALPQRWQEVLWYAEVEGRTMREIGALVGTTPAGAAMLASRARAAFREAWAA